LKFRLGSSPDQLPHQYLQRRLKERDHVRNSLFQSSRHVS
jgi:hypothetical protein